MSENDELITQPELIPGYAYGTPAAARSPLTLEKLEPLKQADEMVTACRARIGEHPHLAR